MRRDNSIWVFFGLIAAGKSTLAENWAARHGMTYLNSDRVRKDLAGLAPTTRIQESLARGIYTSEFTRRTYDELLRRAEDEILCNKSVVLDASYQSRGERRLIRELAGRLGVDVFFILCHCPDDEVKRRLDLREKDPDAVSDGRLEIYLAQKDLFEAPDELPESSLFRLLTTGTIDDLLTELDEIFEVEKHV